MYGKVKNPINEAFETDCDAFRMKMEGVNAFVCPSYISSVDICVSSQWKEPLPVSACDNGAEVTKILLKLAFFLPELWQQYQSQDLCDRNGWGRTVQSEWEPLKISRLSSHSSPAVDVVQRLCVHGYLSAIFYFLYCCKLGYWSAQVVFIVNCFGQTPFGLERGGLPWSRLNHEEYMCIWDRNKVIENHGYNRHCSWWCLSSTVNESNVSFKTNKTICYFIFSTKK